MVKNKMYLERLFCVVKGSYFTRTLHCALLLGLCLVWFSVEGEWGYRVVFGTILVAGDGAAGMAPVRSFLKSCPGFNLAPALAKAEL